MKFLRFIVGFALFVILVAGAAYLVHAALTRESWEQAIGVIRASRLQALECAFVVLLLIALYILTGIRRRKGEQFITFETEGGSVSISMKAIRDFLTRVGDEFAAVVEPRSGNPRDFRIGGSGFEPPGESRNADPGALQDAPGTNP